MNSCFVFSKSSGWTTSQWSTNGSNCLLISSPQLCEGLSSDLRPVRAALSHQPLCKHSYLLGRSLSFSPWPLTSALPPSAPSLRGQQKDDVSGLMLCFTVSVDLLVYGLSARRLSLLLEQCWLRAWRGWGLFQQQVIKSQTDEEESDRRHFLSVSKSLKKKAEASSSACSLMFPQRWFLSCHLESLLPVFLPDWTVCLKPEDLVFDHQEKLLLYWLSRIITGYQRVSAANLSECCNKIQIFT